MRICHCRKPKYKTIPWHAPRPPEVETNTEELDTAVQMVCQDEESTFILAGEDLRELQQKDKLFPTFWYRFHPELGVVVNFRLASSEVPDDETLQTESELTKGMITKWSELEVHDGLVYRRYSKVKRSEPDYQGDTKRFCRRCEESAKYHRGKLLKHCEVDELVLYFDQQSSDVVSR